VHLDFHVDNIDEAIRRALASGGKLEGRPKQSLANLSDPSGNGIDLVESNSA
jgi:predicted enzyme related to lactoylglutathione lyase